MGENFSPFIFKNSQGKPKINVSDSTIIASFDLNEILFPEFNPFVLNSDEKPEVLVIDLFIIV